MLFIHYSFPIQHNLIFYKVNRQNVNSQCKTVILPNALYSPF